MEILNREISKDGEDFVIIEQTKKQYTPSQILDRIQNIRHEKQYLKDQSNRLKEQFDTLTKDEIELTNLIDTTNDDTLDVL